MDGDFLDFLQVLPGESSRMVLLHSFETFNLTMATTDARIEFDADTIGVPERAELVGYFMNLELRCDIS